MENWTQIAAALSLLVAFVVVMAMTLVMNVVARHAERRAEEVYLQAKGLAFSLARSHLQGAYLGLKRQCPSCRSPVNVAAAAHDCRVTARVVDVNCDCGLCACRLGLCRQTDDELIQPMPIGMGLSPFRGHGASVHRD